MMRKIKLISVVLCLTIPFLVAAQNCGVEPLSETWFMHLDTLSAPMAIENEVLCSPNNELFYLRIGTKMHALRLTLSDSGIPKIRYYDFPNHHEHQIKVNKRLKHIGSIPSGSYSCHCSSIHSFHSMEVLLIKWNGACFRLESMQPAVIETVIENKNQWQGIYALCYYLKKTLGNDPMYLGEKKDWK